MKYDFSDLTERLNQINFDDLKYFENNLKKAVYRLRKANYTDSQICNIVKEALNKKLSSNLLTDFLWAGNKHKHDRIYGDN